MKTSSCDFAKSRNLELKGDEDDRHHCESQATGLDSAADREPRARTRDRLAGNNNRRKWHTHADAAFARRRAAQASARTALGQVSHSESRNRGGVGGDTGFSG